MRRLVTCLLVAFVIVAPVQAATPRFSMDSIEKELMCPVCGTRLDLSTSPAANEIRQYIEQKRAAGWTKSQVEAQLVAQFGPTILANTPTSGRGLGAWLGPIGAVAAGLIAVIAAMLVWRRHGRAGPGPDTQPLSEDMQRRVDEALARFDGS